MSAACPSCQAVLTPRELKPGRYHPKCARCSEPFVLVVEWVVSRAPEPAAARSGTAPKAPPRKPAAEEDDLAARMLADEGRDELADRMLAGEATEADPNRTGEIPAETDTARPLAKTRPTPPPAPREADPNATGAFAAPAEPDPNLTGEFTDDVAARLLAGKDPNLTGEFTQPEPPRKPPAARAPAPAKPPPKPAAKPPKADSNLTEPESGPPRHPSAEPTAVEEPPKPAKKPKREKAAPADADSEAPPRLGGYEVIQVLGKGGMG